MRQDQALDEELTHQAARAGAQREPDAHLALSAGRADQHQVRDVGAGNQQHESDGDEQDDQGRPHTTDQLLAQRTIRTVQPALDAGNSLAMSAAIAARSAVADTMSTPSLSRPTRAKLLPPRNCCCVGRQDVSRPDLRLRPRSPGRVGRSPSAGKLNQGGSTPMMFAGRAVERNDPADDARIGAETGGARGGR